MNAMAPQGPERGPSACSTGLKRLAGAPEQRTGQEEGPAVAPSTTPGRDQQVRDRASSRAVSAVLARDEQGGNGRATRGGNDALTRDRPRHTRRIGDNAPGSHEEAR